MENAAAGCEVTRCGVLAWLALVSVLILVLGAVLVVVLVLGTVLVIILAVVLVLILVLVIHFQFPPMMLMRHCRRD